MTIARFFSAKPNKENSSTSVLKRCRKAALLVFLRSCSGSTSKKEFLWSDIYTFTQMKSYLNLVRPDSAMQILHQDIIPTRIKIDVYTFDQSQSSI